MDGVSRIVGEGPGEDDGRAQRHKEGAQGWDEGRWGGETITMLAITMQAITMQAITM